MSWFTANTKHPPLCMRCESGAGAVLIKRVDNFDIYDCRSCGDVLPKQEEAVPRTDKRSRRDSSQINLG